ncbi:MAG: esterase family protein [Calditrichaeota bacterium]|nr:esterase family protein [Calditrichota bacterium]
MKPLNKLYIICVTLLVLSSNVNSATIDTLYVHSAKMDKDLPVIVVTPQAETNTIFPVVYLLHGYSGDFSNWRNKANLDSLADIYQMLLVCPDGSTNSWYIDSPLQPQSQYETFIAEELTQYIDSHYPVFEGRTKKAITGLSMGGHGALYLAARHPDKYFAAGSMSGGVDLTYSTKSWEIAEKIGHYEEYSQRWHENSIVNMIEMIKNANLALMIDCGVDDFFIEVNRTLHHRLILAKVGHDYIERPGKHSWDYWVRVLPYHLFFFREQFSK